MVATDYILCAFIEDQAVSMQFTAWPLHITLVPWFAPDDLPTFNTSLRTAAHTYRPLRTTVQEEHVWGPRTVNVVEKTDKLQRLHERLLQLVLSAGTLLINQQYTGPNYTPHVTQQKTLAATEGEAIEVDRIYLIERGTETGMKTIIDTIRLEEEL